MPVWMMVMVNMPAVAATSPLDFCPCPTLLVHLRVERCTIHIAGEILADIAGILGDLLGDGSKEPASALHRLVSLLVTVGTLLALRLSCVYLDNRGWGWGLGAGAGDLAQNF